MQDLALRRGLGLGSGGSLGGGVLHVLYLFFLLPVFTTAGFCKEINAVMMNIGIKSLQFTFGLHVGGPKCQVVSQQLHDQSRIFIAFFREGVQVRDRIVEGGLGQSTSAVGGAKDFVVEN